MKPIFFLAFIFTILFSVTGFAQKKAEFDYPDYIADSARKTFVKQFNQGKTLYQITCSKCHNKKIDGKEVIPDFSLPQLMDYEMRIYPEHGENLTDKYLTDDEMARIVLFCRYKKKSGVKHIPGTGQ